MKPTFKFALLIVLVLGVTSVAQAIRPMPFHSHSSGMSHRAALRYAAEKFVGCGIITKNDVGKTTYGAGFITVKIGNTTDDRTWADDAWSEELQVGKHVAVFVGGDHQIALASPGCK